MRLKVVRANARVRDSGGHRKRSPERDAPVFARKQVGARHLRATHVLAAANESRSQRGRGGKELTHAHLSVRATVVEHADRVAHAIDLVAVVRYVDCPAGEATQDVGKFELQLPAKVPVKR